LDIKPVLWPTGQVLIAFSASVFLGIWMLGKLYPTRAFNEVALRQSLTGEEGFVGVKTGMQDLVGREARVFTDLKPAGKVEIDGKIYEATVDVGYIPKGATVRIVRAEQGRLYCAR